MFRRLRPEPQFLDIQYNPPPDGSYPPRLLVLDFQHGRVASSSIWLREGETRPLIESEAELRRQGLTYTIIPLNTMLSELKLNGQALAMAQKLKDGDFIQWHNIRAIFQVDPVRDRRVRMEGYTDMNEFKVPLPNQKVKKWAVIEDERISLDGGVTFARWDEIIGLFFQVDPQASVAHLEMPAIQFEATTVFQHDLMALTYSEADAVLKRLFLTIPFDLSVTVLFGYSTLASWFPDAYVAAAIEKIVQPAKNGQRMLPADENYILGIPTRRQLLLSNVKCLFSFVGIIVVFLLVLAVLTLIFGVENFTNLIIVLIGFSMLWVLLDFIKGGWKSMQRESRLRRFRNSSTK